MTTPFLVLYPKGSHIALRYWDRLGLGCRPFLSPSLVPPPLPSRLFPAQEYPAARGLEGPPYRAEQGGQGKWREEMG